MHDVSGHISKLITCTSRKNHLAAHSRLCQEILAAIYIAFVNCTMPHFNLSEPHVIG